MQQLAAHGISETHVIINRMMGYRPDLHRIWVGTSDQQLMTLSREFPGFYRHARNVEEASEAERNKASRPDEGMAEFSEQHKQMGAQLLTTAATLERGYQAFRASGNLQVFRPQLDELGCLQRGGAIAIEQAQQGGADQQIPTGRRRLGLPAVMPVGAVTLNPERDAVVRDHVHAEDIGRSVA